MIRSHGTVTWCRIHYDETQITQWDFQNKGTLTSPAPLSFGLEASTALFPSQHNLFQLPCDRMVQSAYSVRRAFSVFGLKGPTARTSMVLFRALGQKNFNTCIASELVSPRGEKIFKPRPQNRILGFVSTTIIFRRAQPSLSCTWESPLSPQHTLKEQG